MGEDNKGAVRYIIENYKKKYFGENKQGKVRENNKMRDWETT